MKPVTQPTPQQVRDWMQQRQVEHKPPPTPREIREQLGWWMLVNNAKRDCAR